MDAIIGSIGPTALGVFGIIFLVIVGIGAGMVHASRIGRSTYAPGLVSEEERYRRQNGHGPNQSPRV